MRAVLARLRGPDIDDHLRLFEATDWSATSLGPLDSWPQELATQVFLTMLLPDPQSLVLGEESVVIYNQAYGRLIRDHHPAYFGRPVATWTEWLPYFEQMGAIYAQAEKTGRAWVNPTFPMVMNSGGFKENVDFSCTVICLPPPLKGFLGSFKETTATAAAEKRNLILEDLVSLWKTSSSLKALWANVLNSISQHPELFPFCSLYSATLAIQNDPSVSDSSGNESDGCIYTLEGTVESEDSDLSGILQNIDLGTETDGPSRDPFLSYFQRAETTRSPVAMDQSDIPPGWQSIAKARDVGEACRGAVVCPSSSNQLSRVQAFLVFGLSTRDAYNESYQEWVLRLQRELSDIVASILSTQEAARKKREIARRQRLESELVIKELALQRKEAELAALRVEGITKIVGLANVAIFEHDLNGRLVFANDAFYSIVSAHEDQNDRISFLPTEHWDALLRGESRTFELRCRNGTWGLCSALPTRNHSGQIDAVIGVITDIESQKRAEQEACAKLDALEKARIAEKRYYRFLEIIPSGIAVIDPAGQITYATDAWFEMTGHRRCAIGETRWQDVIHEEDLEYVERCFDKLSLESQPLEFQFRMRSPWINPAGEKCGSSWMLCNALPELRKDGTVEQVVSAITEISHLKWAETVNVNRVEEANESKKHALAFIDMTSHEIRNPLGAVIHCADSVSECLTELKILLSDQEDRSLEANTGPAKGYQHLNQLIDTGIESVNTILSCSEHMTNIVTDTLTLSKLDANLLRISPSAVRSVCILQDIQKMFEVEAKRLSVYLSTIVDSSLAAQNAEWMAIDTGRVMQILINLVSNAIKFTRTRKEGPKNVTVRVGASKTRPLDLPVDFTIARALQDSIYDTAEFSENTCYLWFTVEDTGIGMNSEEQNRIFSRFAQGSIRTHKTYGGSGLGLFISRTLSELQGGEIGVSSEPDKGSTFAFFVKAHTTSPPQLQKNSNGLSRLASPATHDLKPGKIPVSVLIVEDNAVNQRVLQRSLKVKGYLTHVANHGQEALDFLRTTKLWKGNEFSPTAPEIDVVLMDVEMPIMDGLESNLPIIAASANARAEQIQMALEAGMDDSITKPFRIPELMPKIDSFAAWARAQG
ncbi:putative histidine kinase HHK19p, partial [Aureobasidium melanogenum]